MGKGTVNQSRNVMFLCFLFDRKYFIKYKLLIIWEISSKKLKWEPSFRNGKWRMWLKPMSRINRREFTRTLQISSRIGSFPCSLMKVVFPFVWNRFSLDSLIFSRVLRSSQYFSCIKNHYSYLSQKRLLP